MKNHALRNALFQIHWFVGITAGIVLALMGVTGALLSFHHPIEDWLNRSVRTVAAQAHKPLSPAELLTRIQLQFPERRILSLQVETAEPTRAARVTLALDAAEPRGNAGGPPGRPHGEVRYVDPYTGEVNADPGNRGEQFFRKVMQLHRWLTWGELGNQAVGKQIVGASALLCLFLAFSGLYLRWPARGSSWRVWLKPNFRLSGRAFLWNLHAIIGTWVLALYVLMSLTGLQWSYDWYRKGLYSLAGVPMPARSAGGPSAGGPSAGGPRAGGARAGGDDPVTQAEIGAAWEGFLAATSDIDVGTVTILLPRTPKDSVEIRYFDRDPAHERAANTIVLDPASGNVIQHERYEDKSVGGKLVASIFPLHSGSFFGVGGSVTYAVAALLMPLFTITGWMLYLRRRRRDAGYKAAAEPSRVEAS
jgi:sulfite reductase (NADPH) flavoprotein alpha-component